MPTLDQLSGYGQAAWLDYIRRAFIDSGELGALVNQGLRGVTSNPSIFEKAIAGSADYDGDLRQLTQSGKSVPEIYEALAFEDIRRAADILRPVFDRTQGADGYVSLEVSPHLAHDTQGTLEEARRLFQALNRPNIMIKIPATPAGIPAIQAAIAEGININVTLIFSLAQYQAVTQAYFAGLEQLADGGGDLSSVSSVASFFVSRIDSAVDPLLEQLPGGNHLQGKIAIAYAKIAYAHFKELSDSARWRKLAEQGARPQRPLWASTSAKNPLYSDTLYVDALIGPDTVNTLPPATLQAFLDHGTLSTSLGDGLDLAQQQLAELEALGVDLQAITTQLLQDGVEAFSVSFEALLASIAEKRDQLISAQLGFSAELGEYQPVVARTLARIKSERVMSRIWAHDHTVWQPEPVEISNRLGWLHIMDAMQEQPLALMQKLTHELRAEGFTRALLLGMGGSSLAPEVFRKTFGVHQGYLDLQVLDSTDPAAVLAFAERLDPAKTAFIVSTKSGGTVETLSFFKYFYSLVADALGSEQAGAHFIAITDPGSSLEALARQYRFRAILLNDPNIGGRYSALSYFGLLPAALIGMNLATLLGRAQIAACNCEGCNMPFNGDNHGAQLGAIMGELAKAGRDKITFIISPAIHSFGDWVEQLIAESSGKDGMGILPVVGELLGPPQDYAADRLFVHLRLDGDDSQDAAVAALQAAGHPLVRLRLVDLYDLGAQFFLWEMATAVAGHCLGINPFDQPNVESAKVLARQMVAAYQERGALPEPTPTLQADGIAVYGAGKPANPAQALTDFLVQAQPGAYVALQAYLQPTPEMDAALSQLRLEIRAATRLATTVGYGPRFLHSTGQLHKGDAGSGLFIQLTADDLRDVPIPDRAGPGAFRDSEIGSSISFSILKRAQALGDRQALLDAGRSVIRFHLGNDALAGLAYLTRALGN